MPKKEGVAQAAQRIIAAASINQSSKTKTDKAFQAAKDFR
jgi:hypothetical protein